jgi:hypothetical protein
VLLSNRILSYGKVLRLLTLSLSLFGQHERTLDVREWKMDSR